MRNPITHTNEMQARYADAISNSIAHTILYREAPTYSKVTPTYTTEVVPLTTTAAISKYACGKTAALNFASYKWPGGGFIRGAMAQEEALCHDSFLYNVLREFDDMYYAPNRANLNRGLYTNCALYNPDIYFPEIEKSCNIITCAAPNLTFAQKNGLDLTQENSVVLAERIRFILAIAASQQIDTLILGAWGCGVFKQNPIEVANQFHFALAPENGYPFKNVIFAVPPGTNYKAFKESKLCK